jgi:uncharacterized membrane protein
VQIHPVFRRMNASRQRRLKLRGWSIPSAYAAGALVVGIIFPRLEHHWLPELVSTMSVASAQAICSAVASGMMALTGIVFSMAFVMVQFSATAYSPRLVLWVARDPVLSHALGIFSSTFLYALMMLAWVDRNKASTVPLISGWMTLALLLASMGMFIALIERIAVLQVNRMLIFTGEQGRRAIHKLYSAPVSAPANPVELDPARVTQTVIFAGRPQVVQTIHVAELVHLAKASDAVVEVVAAVGDTVLEGSPLLRVIGARQTLVEERLKAAFEIGDERTFEQDPKFALRILVDIAIKALSPAVNDPTTAVQALDQIEDLLIRLGHCQLEIGGICDDQGAARMIVPFPTWDDFLRLGLDEIRSYGGSSVQVMRRMNALIQNLHQLLPSNRHAALKYWEKRLQGTVKRSFIDRTEKQDASVPDRQGLGIGDEKSGEEKQPAQNFKDSAKQE